MNLASKAIRVAPVRALGVSAVRQDTVSMKEPLAPVPTADGDSIYQNFIVPDTSKYRELQKRQLYYTVCLCCLYFVETERLHQFDYIPTPTKTKRIVVLMQNNTE